MEITQPALLTTSQGSSCFLDCRLQDWLNSREHPVCYWACARCLILYRAKGAIAEEEDGGLNTTVSALCPQEFGTEGKCATHTPFFKKKTNLQLEASTPSDCKRFATLIPSLPPFPWAYRASSFNWLTWKEFSRKYVKGKTNLQYILWFHPVGQPIPQAFEKKQKIKQTEFQQEIRGKDIWIYF